MTPRDARQECPREIAEVKEQLQETESRLNKKLEQESRDRAEDIEDVRRDLARLEGSEEGTGATSLVGTARRRHDEGTTTRRVGGSEVSRPTRTTDGREDSEETWT